MPAYNAQTIRDLIAADANLAPLAADGAWAAMREAIAAKVVPGPRQSYFVNYRTLMGFFGQGPIEALAATLAASAPITHAIMMQVGSNDGTAGGMDMADASTRDFIASLAGGNGSPFTPEKVATITALGTTTLPWFASVTGQPNPHEGDLMALYAEGDQSNGS